MKFREVEKSRNVAYNLSQIEKLAELREINFRN